MNRLASMQKLNWFFISKINNSNSVICIIRVNKSSVWVRGAKTEHRAFHFKHRHVDSFAQSECWQRISRDAIRIQICRIVRWSGRFDCHGLHLHALHAYAVEVFECDVSKTEAAIDGLFGSVLLCLWNGTTWNTEICPSCQVTKNCPSDPRII